MSKLRVKEILSQKNMTINDLAFKMGSTQENISRIISKDGNPTLETIIKISEALDVKPGDLINEPTGITGFLKVGGDIYDIRSKEDIENVLTKL